MNNVTMPLFKAKRYNKDEYVIGHLVKFGKYGCLNILELDSTLVGHGVVYSFEQERLKAIQEHTLLVSYDGDAWITMAEFEEVFQFHKGMGTFTVANNGEIILNEGE